MDIIRFQQENGTESYGCNYDGSEAELLDGELYGDLTPTGHRVAVKKLLTPIVPPVVFCIGLNYKRHAEEAGHELPRYPVIFMKNPSSVIGPDDSVVIPSICSEPPEVDYEAELAVVIGKKAVNVSESEALDYVLGYTVANDVSARCWQRNAGAGQWVRGKSFDTFCPLGPVIATDIDDPQGLAIQCRLNGEVVQDSNTKDMIFPVAQIVAYLSQSTTLVPGTVILTGTPEGVGYARTPPIFMKPGDTLETEIESLGVLVNPIESDCHNL